MLRKQQVTLGFSVGMNLCHLDLRSSPQMDRFQLQRRLGPREDSEIRPAEQQRELDSLRGDSNQHQQLEGSEQFEQATPSEDNVQSH